MPPRDGHPRAVATAVVRATLAAGVVAALLSVAGDGASPAEPSHRAVWLRARRPPPGAPSTSPRGRAVVGRPRASDECAGETLAALGLPCPPATPPFITYAVADVLSRLKSHKPKARWSRSDLALAVRVLYSTLARAHGCAPALFVGTNIREALPNRTVFGTWADVRPRALPEAKRAHELFSDGWIALSRSKLDFAAELLAEGTDAPVWVDLDTLVFADLTGTSAPWVVPDGGRATGVYGDIWSLDGPSIERVRALEDELVAKAGPLPKFDLQGYFKILLERGDAALGTLQGKLGLHFGFAANACQFNPKKDNTDFGSGPYTFEVDDGRLWCPGGVGNKGVGALSYNQVKFHDMLTGVPQGGTADETVRAVLLGYADLFRAPDAHAWVRRFYCLPPDGEG